MSLDPGTVVAERFEVDRLAGSGGMGAVYRARDRQSGDIVALKVTHGWRSREGTRFAREAHLLSELRHPGIVRYVAHGSTAEGATFLAMEWLDGEDLAERIARERLSVAETLTLASRIAEALAAAHARGVIHRDIKPSNLFLVDRKIDQVRLLDFGVARLGAAATRAATRTGGIVGTPGYMAPEQARGDKEVDARADVFSLGCVVFECVTGRAPFAGEHVMALLAKILLEDAPRASEVSHDVPAPLDDLLARMLSKEPAQRPPNGAAVVAELATVDASAGGPRPGVSTPPAALTAREQRLVSVVLGSGAAITLEQMDAATLTPQEATAVQLSLEAKIAPFGARLVALADGSLIATLAGRGGATDQAARAARCALAMRSELPAVPMALATGRGVLAGRLPFGDVIDRAARVLRRVPAEKRSGAAPPDSDAHIMPIHLDDVTAGLLDARFDIGGDASGLELRGERELAVAARTLLGKPTTCVGRDRELGMLQAIFDECVSGPTASAVLIVGAAGVGKSRLRYEVLRRLREDGEQVEVWMARGDPMSAGSPFGMIAQLIRSAAGLLDGEPLPLRRQKLLARVGRHAATDAAARGVSEPPPGADVLGPAEVTRVTEFLGELVGAGFPDEASVQLRAARRDAVLMGDQMKRAWEDFVSTECGASPVILVLEDMQWGDLPTVKFIEAALRNVQDRPLMVVALARPDVLQIFPNLWSGRDLQQIRLGGLTRKASEKLVRQVLGEEAPQATVARLVEQAAGNALYLEELIRAVVEGRGDTLPESVLAMVQARLEALEAEARRLLRAASVFGQVFWRGGVLGLLGLSERATDADAWIAELVDRELIARRTSKFPDEDEYTFRHALVREAAYAMLTDADRTLGHRLAGEWLERVGESDAMVLAEHFERGAEPARAVGWFRKAAEHAFEGNDVEAALARAHRGIACGAEGEVLGALRCVEAEAHQWRGQFAESQKMGTLAMQFLPVGSALWCRAAGEVAEASGRLGDLNGLVGVCDAIDGIERLEGGAIVMAMARAAMQLLFAGRHDRAERLVERMESALRGVAPGDPAAIASVDRVRGFRALCAGDPGTNLALIEASVGRFEEAGHLREACRQRCNVGYAHLELGAYAQAERALREALAAAERMGLSIVAAAAKHNLGLAVARLGRTEEGEQIEAEAAETFKAMGESRLEALCRDYLAKIAVLSGALDRAEQEVRTAHALAHAMPPIRAQAQATLAHVLFVRGRVDESLAVAKEGMELVRELGGIEEGESLLRLVHAEALHATGDVAAAKSAIAAAAERLLGRKISDAAVRESFLHNVPEHARTLELARAWGAMPDA